MSDLSNAEVTFMRSQRRRGNAGKGGGSIRDWRRKNKTALQTIQQALKENNISFFKNKVLSDDLEAQMWMTFMTSKAPQLDDNGRMVINPNTNIPYLVDVELSPICLKAFLQAVAYKRGTPIATTESTTDDKKEIKVTWTVLGASPDFFRDQANATGLVRIPSEKQKMD